LFAKPFIAAMDTHSDAVVGLAKNRHNLTDMLSASADGELVFWNLPSRKAQYIVNAHPNQVRGIAFANNRVLSADTIFVSTGDDKKVNIWSLAQIKKQYEKAQENLGGDVSQQGVVKVFKNYSTRATFTSKHLLTGCDHSYGEDLFATAGSVVQLWSYERSSPLQTFEWGVDTVTKLRFNPSETNLILSVAMDRSICLFDIRGNTALNRITLKNKSSALAWNPYEPMNFVIGNENGNCYTFDMRKLQEAKMVHKDHIQAVLDVDFAPTGREFVTASFDKTIRIFPFNDGRSREVYHTKRMQQVNSVLYSMDSRYIVTGSEDTNIRVWKSHAADPMKPLLPREKEKIAYYDKLKKKYKYNQEIKRILRHRHLPKFIVKRKALKHQQKVGKARKLENIRQNNRLQDAPFVAERKKDLDTREDGEL
jgi:DDB1- and CUL4-associated factor 13